MYDWILAAHIFGAVAWVGGALTLQVLATRAQRSGNPAYMAAFARDAEWIGMRVYLPASILVLIAGIGLVLEGPWEFGTFWVLFGLVAIFASAITGATFIGPESGRIGKLMAERGPEDAEVRQRMGRIFLVSRIELVVLLLVVADMALKPGQ